MRGARSCLQAGVTLEDPRQTFRAYVACSLRTQQVGAQHCWLSGFDARTKALMNLPSTSSAIASTSIPWPRQKLPGVLYCVDARRLDFDVLETGSRKLAHILGISERASDAANP